MQLKCPYHNHLKKGEVICNVVAENRNLPIPDNQTQLTGFFN